MNKKKNVNLEDLLEEYLERENYSEYDFNYLEDDDNDIPYESAMEP